MTQPAHTLHVGQMVPWPAAPDGSAQIVDMALTNVVIAYWRKGRVCRRRVPARDVANLAATEPLLVTTDNWLGLAVRPKTKTFEEGARYGFAKRNRR